MMWVTLLSVLLLAGAASSIRGGGRNPKQPAACTAENPLLRLVTWNTGLTPWVHDYDKRRDDVIAALNTEDADVMCLQEVWFEADMKQILDTHEQEFPYHFSAIHHDVGQLRTQKRSGRSEGGSADGLEDLQGGGADLAGLDLPSMLVEMQIAKMEGEARSDSGSDSGEGRLNFFQRQEAKKTIPCTMAEIVPAAACVVGKCASSLSDFDAFLQCLLDECVDPMFDLSQSCRSCLLISGTTLVDILGRCLIVDEYYNRMNNPGVMILSKIPLEHAVYHNFHGPSNRTAGERGVLAAKAGGVNVLCTHLSTEIAGTFYPEVDLFPYYASYEEQQAGEIEYLHTRVYSQQEYRNGVAMLGDFNNGPTVESETGQVVLEGIWTRNYALLRDGFNNAFIERSDGENPECTLCPDNAVNAATMNMTGPGSAVDFVLTHSHTSLVDSSSATPFKRVFDEGYLSDHYGVQTTVKCPATDSTDSRRPKPRA